MKDELINIYKFVIRDGDEVRVQRAKYDNFYRIESQAINYIARPWCYAGFVGPKCATKKEIDELYGYSL